MSVQGKTVMITGASRGIGEAAAREFARAGANVVLVARGQDAIAGIAGEIGAQALAIPCDVSKFWEVERAVQAAEDAFGSVDILVNNAGMIEPVAHLAAIDPADWDRVIDVNLKGVFYGMRAALPGMIARGGGSILNISSGAATNAIEGWSHYCASKAGVLMLTRMGDKENRDAGVRVIGLSPGTVATDMQREIKASGVNPVSQLDWSVHIPPDWPAKALVWMCGADADGYLGQDISLRDEGIRRAVGLIA
ncbi:SDR family oxidoreductase [Boseongicola aestuarii]|uniref:Putative oxidoreductase n=1 Tax=Boseongicola aestuarii TaxID=1470561 RepID=A0A238IXR4_9RHOB|nr:SDR family oxidoreductase [Boseongicola aestuarii]SMX23258.1 putative oxidoreductase [Boseongicola aestuarii]